MKPSFHVVVIQETMLDGSNFLSLLVNVKDVNSFFSFSNFSHAMTYISSSLLRPFSSKISFSGSLSDTMISGSGVK